MSTKWPKNLKKNDKPTKWKDKEKQGTDSLILSSIKVWGDAQKWQTCLDSILVYHKYIFILEFPST